MSPNFVFRKFFILVILILLSSHAYSAINEIAIIKISKNGKDQVKSMKTKILKPQMIRLLSTINKSVQQTVFINKEIKNGWKITKFSVGLGAFGIVSLGPWVLAATAKQRMIFSK